MGLLEQILVSGEDSLLYQELVKKKKYTNRIGGGINYLGNMFNYNGPMLFAVDLIHDAQFTPQEILAVHDALDALAAEDELAAKVVKLRYFVGLTIPEIADALDISPRSADRHWAFARAWLKTAIENR